MAQWLVELRGDAREVYLVEADTAEDARAHWFIGGRLQVSEASGMVVEIVTRDDDE